jgi:hypothetical protein
MEMTIEEVITALERDIHNARLCGYQIDQYKIAIATMRKYQRIRAIINNAKDSDGAVKYNWLYEQIKEVVEDGNDNN